MNLENKIAKRINKDIYRDGNNVIKLFSETYAKSDVLNEALNQARAEEAGIAVPQLLEVAKINNRWAIVSKYVEGETLAHFIKQDPEKTKQYLERFVDIQLDMHSKKAPMLCNHTDKMKRKIEQTDLDAATRYDLHSRLRAMPKHNKVCHGDFNPSNIVITPEDKAYILDWSHATQGNASADAARTYLLLTLEGNTELADQYLHLFCKKSRTAIPYVQSWLPIVAASQSVKCKPEEKEILSHWIDVADYE